VPRYKVIIGPLAAATIGGLPSGVASALEQRLRELEEEPAQLAQAVQNKPHKRTGVFGPHGEGMIIATVSDDHQVVIVDQVIWAG
jgi:hypothetical protein